MDRTYTLQELSFAYPEAYLYLPESLKNDSVEFCDKGEHLLCYNSPVNRKRKSLFVLNYDAGRLDDKWKVIYPRLKMQELGNQSNWIDPLEFLRKTG